MKLVLAVIVFSYFSLGAVCGSSDSGTARTCESTCASAAVSDEELEDDLSCRLRCIERCSEAGDFCVRYTFDGEETEIED